VCCHVEVSETSWSLVQRSPTDCGVSNVCDREASKNEAALAHCCAMEKRHLTKRKEHNVRSEISMSLKIKNILFSRM
jgi:hypothetical protein